MDLKNFFEPRNIAVIGASRNPSKVGHVIFKNIIDGGFKGEVIPINPNAEDILRRRAYKSVLELEIKIDLAIIAVPASEVLKVVKECDRKKIKDVLIISAGFREIGNGKLEDELRKFLDSKKMRCVGVNCLGIYDAHHNLDTMFLPRYRLKRPSAGGISFICQSGAIGSAIMDKATEQGNKFSKFISYGNATQVDESDLIEYLGNDASTKVICLYIEGIRDGEKFFRVIKEVSKKKPIVAIKGGLSEAGGRATISHTGSLAGKKEVFFGIFKQTGVIRAESLEDMFNVASLVEKGISFKGERIQIITNGGGYGIISTDAISASENLKMAELNKKTISDLKKVFPETVSVHNPMDLVGDATNERYKLAMEACLNDKNIDGILLIALYQTPLLTSEIVNVIAQENQKAKKPIVVVSTGAEFTEELSRKLSEKGLPTFSYPEDAVKAMDKLVWYDKKMKVK